MKLETQFEDKIKVQQSIVRKIMKSKFFKKQYDCCIADSIISSFVFSVHFRQQYSIYSLEFGRHTFKSHIGEELFNILLDQSKQSNIQKNQLSLCEPTVQQLITVKPKTQYIVQKASNNAMTIFQTITSWKGVALGQNIKVEKAIRDFVSFLKLYQNYELICGLYERELVISLMGPQIINQPQQLTIKNSILKNLIKRPMMWMVVNRSVKLYVENNDQRDIPFMLKFNDNNWRIVSNPDLRIWIETNKVNRDPSIIKCREKIMIPKDPNEEYCYQRSNPQVHYYKYANYFLNTSSMMQIK